MLPSHTALVKYIYLDVVGFTYKRPVEAQTEIITVLNDIVRKAIAACSRLSKLNGGGPQWPFPERFDENLVIDYQRKVWQKAAGI